MTSPKRLFLIDGMAQIYRAHFAMIKNPLITKDGRHTSAIFGFMNSLFKLLRKENPDYILILPWNIKNEIAEQLEYVREWGCECRDGRKAIY